jgi:hypothetical protein
MLLVDRNERAELCHGTVSGAKMRRRLNRRLNYSARSTSIFLISAMALAGLSPFGQVLAQFMMVWQR